MNTVRTFHSQSNASLPYQKAGGASSYLGSVASRVTNHKASKAGSSVGSVASRATSTSRSLHPDQHKNLTPFSSRSSLASGGTRGSSRRELINIDMAISNFHVTFDTQGARFKPGDEMTGKVVMDVWAGLDIKHVEFVITGKGTLRMFQNSSTFIERPKHEVYIDKKIVLIGSSHTGHGVTLDPGRYITNFQYTLPENVPPSVHQFDMGNGYIFDISYSVQARVCDYVHSRHAKPSMLRIIKVTRKSFSVLPPQDWHTIPGALEPVSHSDQVLLFCGPGKSEPTTVVVSMDRGVYPVGDTIKLTIEVLSPGKDVIKDISAELEQQLFFQSDLIKKFRRVLLTAFDDGKNRRLTQNGATMKSTFGLSLPNNIVPSYLPYCKLIDLEYTVKVRVRFRGLGGKIVMRLPLVITPAGDADRKDGELPLFNKPIMQFPYFSKNPLGQNGGHYPTSNSASDDSTQGGALHKSGGAKRNESKQNSVTTKYKTSLNCCGCCLLCLGFGILES